MSISSTQNQFNCNDYSPPRSFFAFNALKNLIVVELSLLNGFVGFFDADFAYVNLHLGGASNKSVNFAFFDAFPSLNVLLRLPNTDDAVILIDLAGSVNSSSYSILRSVSVSTQIRTQIRK